MCKYSEFVNTWQGSDLGVRCGIAIAVQNPVSYVYRPADGYDGDFLALDCLGRHRTSLSVSFRAADELWAGRIKIVDFIGCCEGSVDECLLVRLSGTS